MLNWCWHWFWSDSDQILIRSESDAKLILISQFSFLKPGGWMSAGSGEPLECFIIRASVCPGGMQCLEWDYCKDLPYRETEIHLLWPSTAILTLLRVWSWFHCLCLVALQQLRTAIISTSRPSPSIFWCSIDYFPCAMTLPSNSNSLDIIEQTPTHFTPIFSAYIQSILLAFNLPF